MKPIIFSTDMVQAILSGKKTQTRRVIKPQPSWGKVITEQEALSRALSGFDPYGFRINTPTQSEAVTNAPYKPGDILWVRETWQETDVCHAGGGYDLHTKFVYRADFQPEEGVRTPEKWRSPIYMPKEAARIFLRVTGVGAERLQDVTPGDCLDEGVMNETCYNCLLQAGKCRPQRDVDIFCGGDDAIIDKYAELWDSLNAKRGYGWDKSPWVWVIEFERSEPDAK